MQITRDYGITWHYYTRTVREVHQKVGVRVLVYAFFVRVLVPTRTIKGLQTPAETVSRLVAWRTYSWTKPAT